MWYLMGPEKLIKLILQIMGHGSGRGHGIYMP